MVPDRRSCTTLVGISVGFTGAGGPVSGPRCAYAIAVARANRERVATARRARTAAHP